MSVYRNDMTGMIPSSANPYVRHDHGMPVIEKAEPELLTLRDLDRLVRARLDAARAEWREETRRECQQAWEQGSAWGCQDGVAREAQRVHDVVRDVVNRRLNHIRRALAEGPRTKTTIAAERKFMAGQAVEIERAINDLNIGTAT